MKTVRAFGAAVGIVLMLAAVTASAQPTAGTRLIYYWIPRVTDVPRDSNHPETEMLQYLVSHSDDEKYVVSSDDRNGLDDIIRKRFIVSQTPYPNAFAIYLNDILQRNRDIGLTPQTVLVAGRTTLTLPSGPRFAGLELRGLDLRSYYAEANRAFSARRMSVDDIRQSLGRSLGAFTNSAKAAASDLTAHLDETVAEIADRRLLPANSAAMHRRDVLTPTDNVKITTRSDSIPRAVLDRSTSLFLPAAAPTTVECPNGCRTCSDILGLAALPVSSRARLLIADSGITGAGAPNVVYIPLNQDATDLDPQSHGTFVYSEVVTSRNGLIDPKLVDVAKVAVPPDIEASLKGQTYQWSLSDLKQAIDNFATRFKAEVRDPANPTAGPAWVVNVSAGGQPDVGDAVPSILASRYILLVASAGNDHNARDPETHLFPRIDNANQNILIVGALADDDRSVASYSNFHNNRVDLFVRGSCVCGAPGQISGTSQAAPIVSAAALTLASTYPDWDALAVKWRLIASSDITPEMSACVINGGRERCATGGVLNLARAMKNQTIVRRRSPDGTIDEKPIDVDEEGLAPEWAALLDPANTNRDHQVLRLHRRSCSSDGACEFTIFRRETEPAPVRLTLPPLALRNGGAVQMIDIEDLFLPLR